MGDEGTSPVAVPRVGWDGKGRQSWELEPQQRWVTAGWETGEDLLSWMRPAIYLLRDFKPRTMC